MLTNPSNPTDDHPLLLPSMTNPAQCLSQAHHPPIQRRHSLPFDNIKLPTRSLLTTMTATSPGSTNAVNASIGPNNHKEKRGKVGVGVPNADDHDEQTKEDASTSPQPPRTLTPPPSTSQCHIKRPGHGLATVVDEQLQQWVNNHGSGGSFDNDPLRSTTANRLRKPRLPQRAPPAPRTPGKWRR